MATPNNLTIPLQFQKTVMPKIDEYLPILDEHFKDMKNLLHEDHYAKLKQYHEQNKKEEVNSTNDLKVMKDILDTINGKKVSNFGKTNEKLVKKYEEFLKIEKSKKEDRSAKLLEDALEWQKGQKFQKVVQKEMGVGRYSAGSSFDKYIPIFAENFRIVKNVLTDEQKKRIQSYTDTQEMKKQQKEIFALIHNTDKWFGIPAKYRKLKQKLMDKYDNLILRHKWFEKTMEVLKSLKDKTSGWLGTAFKLLFVFLAFRKEFSALWDIIKPELKALLRQFTNDLLDGLNALLPKGAAEFLKIDPKSRKIKEEKENREKTIKDLIRQQESSRIRTEMKDPRYTKKYKNKSFEESVDEAVKQRMHRYERTFFADEITDKDIKELKDAIKDNTKATKDQVVPQKNNTETKKSQKTSYYEVSPQAATVQLA